MKRGDGKKERAARREDSESTKKNFQDKRARSRKKKKMENIAGQ